VQAHIGLWFQDGRHLVDNLQEHIGQLVGQVLPPRPHAGKGQQLTETGRDALVAAGADHGVVGRVGMHPETLEDLLAELALHAVGDRTLPIGQQVLVDAAEGHARARVVLVAHDEHVGQP